MESSAERSVGTLLKMVRSIVWARMTWAGVIGTHVVAALTVMLVLSAVSVSVAYADAGGLPPPRVFVTHHQITIGGQRIVFTATARETYLYSDTGEPTGSIFSYAYTRDEPAGKQRPVMFLFGGGPGSSSLMLQVGGFGPWAIDPRRFAAGDSGNARSTPPFDVVDNPNSLLDVTDLVFVDPVGTGYSRAIGSGRPEDFWGIDEDAESLAQFIQLWITHNGRWSSPKFYLGESYGGLRGPVLTRALTGGPGYPGFLRAITLNGVVLLVNNLAPSFGAIEGLGATTLAAMEFPNQAMTAWYHRTIDRGGRSLEAFYAQVMRFAQDEYLPALNREAARTLSAAERAAVVGKLCGYTGLPASAYANKLTLSGPEFAQLVLAGRGQVASIYDSRFALSNAISAHDPVLDDAALTHSFPLLVGAMANVEHDKLLIDMSRQFVPIHWRELLPKWNMNRRPAAIPGLPDFKGTLAEEMALSMNRNEGLYLMIGTGYYDLVLPSGPADFVVAHTPFPKDRVVVKRYETGHEIYLGQADKLAQDVRDFVRKASR